MSVFLAKYIIGRRTHRPWLSLPMDSLLCHTHALVSTHFWVLQNANGQEISISKAVILGRKKGRSFQTKPSIC